MKTKFDHKILGFTPSPSEIAIAREVWAKTPNVTSKVLLGQFGTECPGCGKDSEHWRLIPPIKASGAIHFVKYQCECGCTFRKIESCE